MTLFILTEAAVSGGSGDVLFPEEASIDLIRVSDVDFGDGTAAGYGEESAGTGLVQVTYGRSNSGPCPERLDELCNTDFGINADDIDVIIAAVGSGFVLADGTPMAGNGTAREPGSAGNPSASVLVIYDVGQNNGDGVCLHAQDTNAYDLPLPNSVLLYHELSHGYHIALGDLLSLETDDPCNNASPEEQRAMQDENDMRTQIGERLRTTTNHCGNAGVDGSCATGNGDCCVVATVATGSAYSTEVSTLRRVRDGLLRRSEIGYDFFSHLHHDYYGFSPEVCRLMARSRALLHDVREHYVGPLTVCLELLVAYTMGGIDEHELGRRAVARVRDSEALARLTPAQLDAAQAVLDGGSLAALPGSDELRQLAALLDERARDSEFVGWALLQPIRMVLDVLRWVAAQVAPEVIGARLARAFDAWAVQVPLTDVWHGLSRYALAEEIEFLGRVLVRTPAARSALRERVVAHLGGRNDVATLFHAAWGDSKEMLQ